MFTYAFVAAYFVETFEFFATNVGRFVAFVHVHTVRFITGQFVDASVAFGATAYAFVWAFFFASLARRIAFVANVGASRILAVFSCAALTLLHKTFIYILAKIRFRVELPARFARQTIVLTFRRTIRTRLVTFFNKQDNILLKILLASKFSTNFFSILI